MGVNFIEPCEAHEAEDTHGVYKKVPNEVKWLFFDVGSTLVDESKVYEDRMRKIAEMAKVPYEYVYEMAVGFYRENKKGDIETARKLNVEKPRWKTECEILYKDTKYCLKMLSGRDDREHPLENMPCENAPEAYGLLPE